MVSKEKPSGDSIVFLDDFYTHVDKDRVKWMAMIGKNSHPDLNPSSDMVFDFCARYGLSIKKTTIEQRVVDSSQPLCSNLVFVLVLGTRSG